MRNPSLICLMLLCLGVSLGCSSQEKTEAEAAAAQKAGGEKVEVDLWVKQDAGSIDEITVTPPFLGIKEKQAFVWTVTVDMGAEYKLNVKTASGMSVEEGKSQFIVFAGDAKDASKVMSLKLDGGYLKLVPKEVPTRKPMPVDQPTEGGTADHATTDGESTAPEAEIVLEPKQITWENKVKMENDLATIGLKMNAQNKERKHLEEEMETLAENSPAWAELKQLHEIVRLRIIKLVHDSEALEKLYKQLLKKLIPKDGTTSKSPETPKTPGSAATDVPPVPLDSAGNPLKGRRVKNGHWTFEMFGDDDKTTGVVFKWNGKEWVEVK